ncbi:FAD-dependent oxidoreductase [Streptomyces sp. NPDC050560]|uniref:FAD-dependent oxidoreductase n=1 Tax=Streptomyces sp. NPDC050560 TaxID=3365630 RepID=UPI0037BBB177
MSGWDAETAVVGLGAWGAAALWRLASRGVDTVGFERFTPGHALGPWQDGSRVFRLACSEHPGLVPLARRSRELWPELSDGGPAGLFTASGALVIGPENGSLAGGTLRAARAHGVPVRTFSATALRFQFPRHTGMPAHHTGVWEPSAGLLRPGRAAGTAVALAQEAGARVFSDCRVTAVELVPGGAHVHTAQRSMRVRQVVLAAGAWLPALLPGLPLETVRMPVTWFRPFEPDGDFDLERFPAFLRQLEDGRVLWGHGSGGGNDIRVTLDDPGVAAKPVDPEDPDHSVTPDDWSGLSRLLSAKVPGLSPVPARVAVATRTRAPDGHPLLGRPGGDPRLVVAGGDNAHGFAHSPGVGEAVADLVLGTALDPALAALSPDRFA